MTRQRAFRLYALGQGAILVGAWLMHQSGSMLPLALGASAGLMLTAPLVKHFGARFARRRG
ncbi:MAG: hypothetical protein EOP40_09465 [Rubrivivax sp.]|nr:MAG: hypothetical protein EOP40_09465 [Rubrivivax sp.]